MNVKSTTTVAMEYRAAAEQDGSQFVFRAEITAENDSDAFDKGAALGQLVAKMQEGFRHGTVILTPIIEVPPAEKVTPKSGPTRCFACSDRGTIVGPVQRPNGAPTGALRAEPCPVCQKKAA